MAQDTVVFDALIILYEALAKTGLYTISKLIDWVDDKGAPQEGILSLTMGSGYFTGSLLELKSFDETTRRAIDRPIEISAQMFVESKYPSSTDPWVLPT